jgi:hypothetical protein
VKNVEVLILNDRRELRDYEDTVQLNELDKLEVFIYTAQSSIHCPGPHFFQGWEAQRNPEISGACTEGAAASKSYTGQKGSIAALVCRVGPVSNNSG